MLVIDGVELILVDKLLKMWKLQRDHSMRSQQVHHARRKIVEVRHLCQHIVSDDEIGGLAFGYEFLRKSKTEKFDQRGNIFSPGYIGYIGRRLNTHHRHTQRQKMLKQVSIIAGDLIHAAICAKAQPALDHSAIAPR